MPSASLGPVSVTSTHLWWWAVTASRVVVSSTAVGGRRSPIAESALELVCFHTGGL